MNDSNPDEELNPADKSLSRRAFIRTASVVGAGTLATLTASADAADPKRDKRPQETAHAADDNSIRSFVSLHSFVSLSEELTGIKPLDQHLAAEYMIRYANNPAVGPYLQGLLAAYNSIERLPRSEQPAAWDSRVLGANSFFRPAAEQLVYLWYMGTFALRDQKNPNTVVWQYDSGQQYNRGLIWQVIHSHPPMTTPSIWVERPRPAS
jgi:hypothetical protein